MSKSHDLGDSGGDINNRMSITRYLTLTKHNLLRRLLKRLLKFQSCVISLARLPFHSTSPPWKQLTSIPQLVNRERRRLAGHVGRGERSVFQPGAVGLKAVGICLRDENGSQVVAGDLLADDAVGAGHIPGGVERGGGHSGGGGGEEREGKGCGVHFCDWFGLASVV